jgi:hypothetical protein
LGGGWGGGAGRVSGRVPVCPAGDRPFTSARYLPGALTELGRVTEASVPVVPEL